MNPEIYSKAVQCYVLPTKLLKLNPKSPNTNTSSESVDPSSTKPRCVSLIYITLSQCCTALTCLTHGPQKIKILRSSLNANLMKICFVNHPYFAEGNLRENLLKVQKDLFIVLAHQLRGHMLPYLFDALRHSLPRKKLVSNNHFRGFYSV